MAHDVFISYASKDKNIADAVCATLERERIRCWIAPRDVPPGSDYRTRIVDAIEASRAFVLVFSASANQSRHVPREVEIALDSGKPVIPFRIEDVTPAGGLQYCLTNIHWLDALTEPVEAHIQRLVGTLKAVFDGSAAPPPAPVAAGLSARLRSRRGLMGGLAAVGVVLALGLVSWFALDRPAEPDTAALHRGGSTAIPAVEPAFTPSLGGSSSRPPSFNCQIAPGFCAVNPGPDVGRIRFGEAENQLDRTIEGPLTGRHFVPYRLGSTDLFFQVESGDGRRGPVQQIALERARGVKQWQSGRRLQAEESGGDKAFPFLFVGYEIRDKTLSYRPDAPPGVATVQYTFDQGGFFDAVKSGVGFGFEGPLADSRIRVRFVMGDGTERGPYEYRLTDALTLALEVYRQGLLAKLERHVWCTRIGFALPMPVPDSKGLPVREYMRQLQDAQSVRSQLQSKDLSFVEQAPAIACRAGSSGRLGDLDRPSYWAAARELRLGTEPGQLDRVVSLPEPSDELTTGAGTWNAVLPAAATAVYAQVTFFDGTTSPEVRLRLDEVGPSAPR